MTKTIGKTLKRGLSLMFVITLLASMLTVPAQAVPQIYGTQIAAGHKYTFVPSFSTGKALDLSGNIAWPSEGNANIQIWGSNWTDAQVFTIEYVYGEWYKIVHTASGRVLDIAGGGPYGNVILWDYQEGVNQLWSFKMDGDGYRIRSKTGSYLSVELGGGNNVQAEAYDGANRQLWYLDDLSKYVTDSRCYDNYFGCYRLNNVITVVPGQSTIAYVQFRTNEPNATFFDTQNSWPISSKVKADDSSIRAGSVGTCGICPIEITVPSWLSLGTYPINMVLTKTSKDPSTGKSWTENVVMTNVLRVQVVS